MHQYRSYTQYDSCMFYEWTIIFLSNVLVHYSVSRTRTVFLLRLIITDDFKKHCWHLPKILNVCDLKQFVEIKHVL
jgi:hypothetical protein